MAGPELPPPYLAAEEQPRPNLYGRIIDPSQLPMPPGELPETLVEALIVADDTLRIGQHTIELSPQEVYALNALLWLRDRPRAASDIRALGFTTENVRADAKFSSIMKSLLEKVNDSTGLPLIKKWGKARGTTYKVSAHLDVVDYRGVPEDAIPPVVDLDPQAIELEDDELGLSHPRDIAIVSVVKGYASSPSVHRRVCALLADNPGIHYPDTDRPPEYAHVNLTTTARDTLFQALFTSIDRGIAVYEAHGLTNLEETQQDALVELAAAYELAVIANQGLVLSIAQHYDRHELLPFQDLVKAGTIGLLTGIRRFEISRGLKFSTHASYWIHESIKRALANTSRVIRIPVTVHNAWLETCRRLGEFSRNLDHEATVDELANAANMSVNGLRQLLQWGAPHLTSLDAPVSTSGPYKISEFGSILPLRSSARALERVLDRVAIDELLDAAGLEITEQVVLSLGYGLFLPHLAKITIGSRKKRVSYLAAFAAAQKIEPQAITLPAIGNILDASTESIQKIHARALQKLRAAAGNAADLGEGEV